MGNGSKEGTKGAITASVFGGVRRKVDRRGTYYLTKSDS